MKISKKLFLPLLILFFITVGQISFYQPAQAATDLWNNQVGLGSSDDSVAQVYGGGTPQDPRVIAAMVIKIILSFLGLIFLSLIIYAGFRWMTARGNDEQVKEAMDIMRNSIIGLVIVLTAYAITDFVIVCVLDAATGDTIWLCKDN